MLIIDHERFGDRVEFESVEEAEQAIRECGYAVKFEMLGNRVMFEDEVVGYELDARDTAGQPIR